jgi:hypothetical protein
MPPFLATPFEKEDILQLEPKEKCSSYRAGITEFSMSFLPVYQINTSVL